MIKNMKKLVVVPLERVNDVAFESDRGIVRKAFKGKYEEIKRNIFSKNTMDFYDDYAVYYSENNKMEAIEVFGKTKVIIHGKQVFPGKIEDIKLLFPNLKQSDDGFIDKENSVAITVDQDDDSIIGSILFGIKNYY